jgi:putative addiction module component (TIGR02574 family)
VADIGGGINGSACFGVLKNNTKLIGPQRANSDRGNLHLMSQISVADILELPVQERIQLVEMIWESIAAVPHAIEVSPELKTELEVRLADFERNPEAGYSWDQVKAHLKSGSWRTA